MTNDAVGTWSAKAAANTKKKKCKYFRMSKLIAFRIDSNIMGKQIIFRQRNANIQSGKARLVASNESQVALVDPSRTMKDCVDPFMCHRRMLRPTTFVSVLSG